MSHSVADPHVLENGRIIDGTGAPGFVGSVRIEGGEIADIGEVSLDGAQRVDCRDKVIAPGFIDAHSHMDFFAASENPHHFDPFTAQGITTFVAGNCGFSPFGFEADTPHKHLIEHSLFRAGGQGLRWHTFEQYGQALEGIGLTQNMLHLVGHGACRTSLSGFEARPLNATEFERMLTMLDNAMADGAAGVSLGLQYKPGVFSKLDELERVARLVKERDKILTVHAKAYSSFSGTYPMVPFGRPHNLKAIEDMLGVARRTGVRLQYSHLIFVGRQTWKTFDQAIALFDEAIADGVDVKFDMFPYGCGATLLNTLLPEWFMARMPGSLHERGSLTRLWLEAALGFRIVGWGYPEMQIADASCDEYDEFNGMFLPEIAKHVGKSPFATLIDILDKSHVEARVLNHGYYNEDIVERLMQHPAVLFATDAWPEPEGGCQNPAAFGTFPRFLRNVRKHGRPNLEEVVHKMTGATAARFQLEHRGTLRLGHAADVTVFDPAEVEDNTAEGGNDAAPSGIEHVFINGRPALLSGELRPARGAGRLLT